MPLINALYKCLAHVADMCFIMDGSNKICKILASSGSGEAFRSSYDSQQ